MSVTAYFLSAALSTAQPMAEEGPKYADRAPLRCRPAPYYVTTREGRLVPRMLVERNPSIEVMDRQGRPCHLTRTPEDASPRFRTAD